MSAKLSSETATNSNQQHGTRPASTDSSTKLHTNNNTTHTLTLAHGNKPQRQHQTHQQRNRGSSNVTASSRASALPHAQSESMTDVDQNQHHIDPPRPGLQWNVIDDEVLKNPNESPSVVRLRQEMLSSEIDIDVPPTVSEAERRKQFLLYLEQKGIVDQLTEFIKQLFNSENLEDESDAIKFLRRYFMLTLKPPSSADACLKKFKERYNEFVEVDQNNKKLLSDIGKLDQAIEKVYQTLMDPNLCRVAANEMESGQKAHEAPSVKETADTGKHHHVLHNAGGMTHLAVPHSAHGAAGGAVHVGRSSGHDASVSNAEPTNNTKQKAVEKGRKKVKKTEARKSR